VHISSHLNIVDESKEEEEKKTQSKNKSREKKKNFLIFCNRKTNWIRSIE